MATVRSARRRVAPRPSTPDAAWLGALADGNHDSLESLMDRHQGALETFIECMGPHVPADEVIEEAATGMESAVSHGAGPLVAARPYLLTAVYQLHLTRMAPGESGGADPRDPGRPVMLDDPPLWRGLPLVEGYLLLPERLQATLWHCIVEELSDATVGEILGLPGHTIPRLLTIALEQLAVSCGMERFFVVQDRTCQAVSAMVAGYHQGTLPDGDREFAAKHLSTCDDCWAAVEALDDLNAGVAERIGQWFLGSSVRGYRSVMSAHTPAAPVGDPSTGANPTRTPQRSRATAATSSAPAMHDDANLAADDEPDVIVSAPITGHTGQVPSVTTSSQTTESDPAISDDSHDAEVLDGPIDDGTFDGAFPTAADFTDQHDATFDAAELVDEAVVFDDLPSGPETEEIDLVARRLISPGTSGEHNSRVLGGGNSTKADMSSVLVAAGILAVTLGVCLWTYVWWTSTAASVNAPTEPAPTTTAAPPKAPPAEPKETTRNSKRPVKGTATVSLTASVPIAHGK